jgi:hypothetical protein
MNVKGEAYNSSCLPITSKESQLYSTPPTSKLLNLEKLLGIAPSGVLTSDVVGLRERRCRSSGVQLIMLLLMLMLMSIATPAGGVVRVSELVVVLADLK